MQWCPVCSSRLSLPAFNSVRLAIPLSCNNGTRSCSISLMPQGPQVALDWALSVHQKWKKVDGRVANTAHICKTYGLCKTWVVRLPNGVYEFMSAYADYFGQVWTDYFYYWPYDYPKDSSLLGWDDDLWEQGVDMMLATHEACLRVEECSGMY
ncbi:uncharacterized protein C8Q71DRAFT_727126 [Rhodofomes roseus]|uniref:Uncharacterized protein n=1 Tax=Rhodofomes roseus TaxID=34475 RepID=A0ABQ8K2F7_9APHY|nr:uncharacterized protein C8Q71DRAFT_727126 [Rhodofomes roseus]KAH9830934.1 hypothetical protein C8Q71DRAFT_727126 [Rhodofomes roseus]